jgi:hypothetical protein
MKPGFRLTLVVVFFCVASASGADDDTNRSEVTFTQRSPLTNPKELAQRLSQKKLDNDYDLSKEPFLRYVPETYNPAKPMGLIVLINYKETSALPDVLPILAERNLAFVAAENDGQPWAAKCGLAVDAVHNMQLLYKVDPARVYIFGFDHDYCAQRLELGFADVFSGMVVTEAYSFWKKVQTSDRRSYWTPELPPPPAKYLPLARTHPLFFTAQSDDESHKMWPKAFQADGFREVKAIKITMQDYHYPHYDKKWFVEALDFLDAHAADRKARTIATRAATTRPVTTRPMAKPITATPTKK